MDVFLKTVGGCTGGDSGWMYWWRQWVDVFLKTVGGCVFEDSGLMCF